MTTSNMDAPILAQIKKETKISLPQIEQVLNLLEEGNTIPFIARYRKEATGSLDEVQIHEIQQQYQYLSQLADRKAEVVRLIGDQDKLTPELETEIQQATTLQQVEDLYRPYKQKRRTKATVAIEQGLEPLAEWLLDTGDTTSTPETYAANFVSDEVTSPEEALAGAQEILAQQVSDRADFRTFIRQYTRYNGQVVTQVKDQDGDPNQVYQMYYDFSMPVTEQASHRILAINRAEKEGVISCKIQVEAEPAINYMTQRFIPADLSEDKAEYVQAAVEDAYKRFIQPAIERELRGDLTAEADQQAIRVFGENLRHLLLQPPLKGKVVMGFDPAYRTGCKLAVIDDTGRVLTKGVIYPHKPAAQAKRQAAKGELKQMIEDYHVDVIAIGNGTASRESEQFVSDLIQEEGLDTQFIVVNEAGASVYSASALAREEFPDYEVEERSAVSIARRLQDPLAELIKIDPKSMGVGQYQHDVAQKELTEQLDFVVDMTVNQVGVDINTASVPLLQHVSGLTAATAKNIVLLRNEIGQYESREQIKDVKRLGAKTFEQAVGFLRILGGENPLDMTSIHPESYPGALEILAAADLTVDQIGSDIALDRLDQLDVDQLVEATGLGLETVEDILFGLKHPKADIRDGQDAPILRDDVLTLEDLSVGMQLQGVVRNVVDFGAFVDIGVKEDGLIHISKLTDRFVKHPFDVVSVGDIVNVEVISVDYDKGRIGLKAVSEL